MADSRHSGWFDDESLGCALEALAVLNPEASAVARLRLLQDLPGDDVVRRLEMSRRQVDLHWRFARAFLQKHLERGGEA